MILNRKKKDYVYEMIKDTYNSDGMNSLVIAIEQAIKENNFYNFNNDNHNVDRVLKELEKDSPASIKKYGLNVSFLYRVCDLYVKKAKQSTKDHSTLEDYIRNSSMSEEGLTGSIFVLMYNEIAKEGHKLSELTVDEQFKNLRNYVGSKMLFHALNIDMGNVFVNQIKKEELLKKVKEKSFFKNTAQNLRLFLQRKNSQLVSGIKDIDENYEQQIIRNKYKVENKKEVHRDVGKTMHVVSTIGYHRENQEDAALIMVHPNNPKLKIAFVCDGAGGYNKGEVASYYLSKSIQKWFIKEGEHLYRADTDEEQNKKIISGLQEINENGFTDLNKRAETGNFAITTMVGAIIIDGKAKIVHFGDSRAYSVKNGELSQITLDHSMARQDFEGFGKNTSPYTQIDDTRFYTNSNVITKAVFDGREIIDKSCIQTLEKGTYDKIILCSDGVSDCMSNEEIAYFSKNVKGKRLASFLVDAANINVSKIPLYLKKFADMEKHFKNKQYNTLIEPSKDNATAVVVETDKDDELER